MRQKPEAQSDDDVSEDARRAPARGYETAHRISLRESLLLLVLICILPGIAFSSYLVHANYQLEKQRVARETELLSSRVLADLERELAAIESGLRVLATAESLKSGDLGRFHKVARAALTSQSVLNYILTDREGRQVLNTLRPWGSPLPTTGTPEQLDEVFRSGNTVLTPLFRGPVTGKPIIAMGVPVTDRDGKIIYSLNIGLLPGQLSGLLNSQSLPDGWLVAILDSAGTIAGRSRDAERFVGQKAVPELVLRLQSAQSGTMEAITKEGIPVLTALAHSSKWGWGIATGAPKALLEAGMIRMYYSLGAAVLLFIALGSWLAARITRQVVTSVHYLNDAALALREGKPLNLPKVQLKEAEAVGHAIVQASHLMASVRHRAYHDPLTELGNRALFYELVDHQLALAEREHGTLAILAIDLDLFKKVNDEEGHAAGDRLLASVARRIENTIRASDAAARMGGDEFSILLIDTNTERALETAQRLITRLSEPYEGITTPVSASIGIAVYPDAGTNLAQLLEKADQALYAAKHAGRKTCCVAESSYKQP